MPSSYVLQKDDEEFQLWIDFQYKGIATPSAMPKGEWRIGLKLFSVETRGYLNGLLDAAAAKRKAATIDPQGPDCFIRSLSNYRKNQT